MLLRSVMLITPMLVLATCTKPRVTTGAAPTAETTNVKPEPSSMIVAPSDVANGFMLEVHSAEATDPAPEANVVAATQPLAAKDVERVLARMPAIEVSSASQQTSFAVRGKSLPPPRTGTTEQIAFPQAERPAATPPKPVVRPLTVRRFAPVGAVPIAADLNVTFSQPMVAVGTVDQTVANVPVHLSPKVEGKWQWLGGETLTFKPTVRMPMATRFTVEVPKGTRSAADGVLATAVKWTFSTPPITIEEAYPRDSSGIKLTPMVFIRFDQRIDSKALLSHVKVTAGGSDVAMRLATAEEIQADDNARYGVQRSEPGRFLVMTPEKPLPMATKVEITIAKGAPSAEGPLTTTKAQSFSFTTYGPFKLEQGTCWADPCRPDSGINLTFSNDIDPRSYKDALVHISPEYSAQLSLSGRTISITGKKKSKTRYTITVDKELRDIYGQTLSAPATYSVNVGDSYPQLTLAREGFATMAPGRPSIDVISMGQPKVHVAVYKVAHSDWNAYRAFMRDLQNNTAKAKAPGTLVRESDIEVQGSIDELVASPVDLKPALDGDVGNVVVVASGKRRYRDDISRTAVWVQITPLALDAFDDPNELTAWVTELATGNPVGGASVELMPVGTKAKSDDDGVARLSLVQRTRNEEPYLLARRGKDTVILPATTSWWDSGRWLQRSYGAQGLVWVTDDRGMYKPGETASFKGFARRLAGNKESQLEAITSRQLKYEVVDPRGNKVAEGVTPLSRLGGFDFNVKLPDNVNLGSASVRLKEDDGSIGYHTFEIQEFRRPEFEVTASVNDGAHVIGEQQSATVKAGYYAGGALAGAPVSWRITTSDASFTPANREGFIFGIWAPWWRMHDYDDYGGHRGYGGGVTTMAEGTTDARGMHRITIDPKSVKPERATTVDIEANVTDVNRQAWSARTSMLVHAATSYVGVKPERMFVEVGKDAHFDIIVTDLDGKAEAGRDVRLSVVRSSTRPENGVWTAFHVEEAKATVTSKDAPVRWTFTPKEGGTHQLSFDVSDSRGRVNHTELTLYVPGEKRPPVEKVTHEQLTLIPSKKAYAPGETAEILVQAPFNSGSGIALIERNGLLGTKHIDLRDGSAIVKVPVSEAHAPNLHVAIELAGQAPSPDGKGTRPAFASGTLSLSVTADHVRLTLDVVPESRGLSPGESTKVAVTVRDAKGKPVSDAEVALIVVDEAVLALSGFSLKDPLDVMMPQRGADVYSVYLRDSVLIARREENNDAEAEEMSPSEIADGVSAKSALAASPVMAMRPQSAARERKKESDAAPEPTIAVRRDFSALAAFVPKLTTDGAGRTSTTVKLPDNLTRYRVMAVAAGSITQFGKGESTITARLPLMVRPSAPRFLNFGDRFDLPVVLHNQTEQAMEVDVVARAVNAELGVPGLRAQVGPGQRVEVRFPAKTVAAGTARFQIGATSGKASDAADISLKVWTPATSESFATYGVLDGNAVIKQPLAAPTDVFVEAGGLKVSTASTALQSLTDAVIYLADYPYGCSEQLASRILALVAMKDVLAAFHGEAVPDSGTLRSSVESDLKVLATRQASNGGFGFWGRDNVSPYASVHVAHAMVRAKAAGFPVDDEVTARALRYAANIDDELKDYSVATRDVVVAYALAVRARAGDVDIARARTLVTKTGVNKVSVEAMGHLLPVAHRAKETALLRTLTHELERRVTETAASAHFVTNYDDGAHLILASERRADAIVLAGLVEAQPTADLIPKVVRGLLDGRRKGRWYTTQENVFVLLGVGDYFNVFEKQTPEFVARLWLGDDYAGEAAFHGRETVTRELDVPMAKLVSASKDLVLQKEGAGRLYYRIGLDYAPKSLDLAARNNGFEVERTYEAVDDPASVRRDADGTWHVKAGARVRVRLKMVAQAVRYHVALVDPLPAGFEAINAALATSESVPGDDQDDGDVRPLGRGRRYFWYRSEWYEHQNMRDERVEAFATEVWAGVHAYTYVARATTPGSFVVPPTKAEEMYAPETFGRSASTRVVVE